MSRGRRRLLLVTWALLSFGLGVRAFARGLLADRATPGAAITAVTIDVNRASVHELATLPGIGGVRAEAIVLDRIRHGAFRSVDDLARVDGLGPEIVAMLRPFAVCASTR